MSRPVQLTDEERKQRKKEKDDLIISFRLPRIEDKEKLSKFSEQYQSLNFCIIDLIKTHPDFKKFKFDSSKCSVIV